MITEAPAGYTGKINGGTKSQAIYRSLWQHQINISIPVRARKAEPRITIALRDRSMMTKLV